MSVLDGWMRDLLGVDNDEFERSISVKGPLPMAMFNSLVGLVDRSGAADQIAVWDRQGRKSNAGRKPLIPARAVLVLDLMAAMWGHAAHFEELARTLAYRLTREQFAALGVRWEDLPPGVWYARIWRAKHRLLAIIDPYHATQKRRKLNGDEYAAALADYDDAREERLSFVAQALVDASVAMMPKRYAERYAGDVALDSTLVEILGAVEADTYNGARRNIDFTAGTYTHSHREDPMTPTERAKPGFELDTVTMVNARRQIDIEAGRQPAFFPQLITGVGFHRPGEITKGPLRAMLQHTRTFQKTGLMIADRAFNNLVSENFQMPLRRLGWEGAYDYKRNQLGHRATVDGMPIILVDGRLYVHYMPQHLRQMTHWYANNEINPDTGTVPTREQRNQAIAARAPYELKPKGKPDKDGYQRFFYPDPRSYMPFDPVTGKRVKSTLRGTVTVPPQANIVKHIQRHPWKSDIWWKVYGQRNHVESSNKNLKDARSTALAEPKMRAIRGLAAQFMVASAAVVASNIRRIVTALRREAADKTAPRKRAPRRPAPLLPKDDQAKLILTSGTSPPA